ncbi:MAG: hypothetical protein HY706_01940 [Candidatus Hydrogenedentes bacterium]|nr:hypothetical protein [Candidatus Hydrogenedentota bacterium]
MRKYTLTGILVLVAAAGLALRQALPRHQHAPRGLQVSPAENDLGATIKGGEALEKSVTLTNHGRRPLEVLAKLTCGCSSATPAEFTLAPGASQPVQVRIVPPSKMPNYQISVQFVEKSTGELLGNTRFYGESVPWLAADVQTVQFEILGERGEAQRTVQFRNLSEKPFQGQVALSGEAAKYLSLARTELTLAPGAADVIRITSHYPGARRTRGALKLSSLTGAQAALELDVVLTGQPVYVTEPPSLLWTTGTPLPGEMKISLSRADRARFGILEARLEPPVPWLTPVVENTQAGDTHVISLKIQQEGMGQPYFGKLVVGTDCADYPQAAPIPLIGIEPTGPTRPTGT